MSLSISTNTLYFLRYQLRLPPLRPFSVSSTSRSGHSKWATIKHEKAKNDSRKNKNRTIFIHDIVHAVRVHGADPKYNAKLATAISNAQRTGMPKTSIDAAVLRGLGKSASGAKLEGLIVEAMWGRDKPVAMIVEAETDSKAMALQDLRSMLKSAGGNQTPTQFLFQRRGRIKFPDGHDLDADRVMEAVLDQTGVIDVSTDDEGKVVVDTEPDAVKAIEDCAAERINVQAERSEILWLPNQETVVDGLEETQLQEMDELTDKLEDYPGVQKVWTNLATRQDMV